MEMVLLPHLCAVPAVVINSRTEAQDMSIAFEDRNETELLSSFGEIPHLRICLNSLKVPITSSNLVLNKDGFSNGRFSREVRGTRILVYRTAYTQV